MSQYCDHIDVAFCERDSFEVAFDDAPDYVGFAQAVTSTRILGYFPSVEALTEAVPNPNIGDTYGIGEEAPYNLYVYSANGWIDNGVPSGPPGPPGTQGNDGPPGPPGPAAAVTAWEVRYQASASGTTIPTGTWSVNIPEVPDGQFLWTRTEVTYNDGTTTTSYSVVRGAGGGAVTRDAIIDALGYTPADDATVETELDEKVNYSDALTLEEIAASTDLSGKVASAEAVKDVNNKIVELKNGTYIGTAYNVSNISLVFLPQKTAYPVQTVIELSVTRLEFNYQAVITPLPTLRWAQANANGYLLAFNESLAYQGICSVSIAV